MTMQMTAINANGDGFQSDFIFATPKVIVIMSFRGFQEESKQNSLHGLIFVSFIAIIIAFFSLVSEVHINSIIFVVVNLCWCFYYKLKNISF